MIVNYKRKTFIVQAIIGLYSKHIIILVFILNFRNCCKIFQCKASLATFQEYSPFIKIPNLIMLLISFSFNGAIIFLYKYSCLCFNKSVFNWIFCQCLYSRKNPIAWNHGTDGRISVTVIILALQADLTHKKCFIPWPWRRMRLVQIFHRV